MIRQKGTPYAELGLDDPLLNQLIDAVLAHPINRPIGATPRGVRLARRLEVVLEILQPLTLDFTREDGDVVPAKRP